MRKYQFTFVVLILAIFAFAVTGSMAAPTGGTPATAKAVAAPPEEFADLRLPTPAEIGVRSSNALIPVNFKDGEWAGELMIDDPASVSLTVFAPTAETWQVTLRTPEGRYFALNRQNEANAVRYQPAEIGLSQAEKYQGDMYSFDQLTAGKALVTISAPTADGTEGFLLVSSESNTQLFAHLTSHALLAGNEVGLVAYAFDATADNSESAPTPLAGVIETAVMQLSLPSGETRMVTMYDDGRHQDGAANDGIFGGTFLATATGDYTAQVIANGATKDAQPFMRTSEHTFPIIEPSMSLADRLVRSRIADDTALTLYVPVTVNNPTAVNDVLVAAEVWGKGADGMVPVAWISGITSANLKRNADSVPLTLDGRWITLANAEAPFELRNIRLQDAATHIPLAEMASLPVRITSLPEQAQNRVTAVSDDMLMGKRPETPPGLSDQSAGLTLDDAPTAAGGKLLLVHGYCSGGVWPTNHFSDYAVFQDYNQNRSHDQFAQLIRNFGAQYPSFGVVAHSQGGAASLHLYTYYWSGLDYSSGSRLIQSVGTPYQGTALAGNLAVLGEVFGAGCGTNWDLTYDGASLWLANIPSWARSRVYYYTTSFNDRWWAYDYCHMATDLFLSDPDDGTTEKWAGQLSGANNMGHKTGWCHTQSMRDPGQTTDYSRNSTMNAYANR